MTLLSVGVDHDHVPLDLLERVTLTDERCMKLLHALHQGPNLHEVVVLSTCLRTEVYGTFDRFHGAIDEVAAALAEGAGLDPAALSDRLTIHFDRGVATHLFSVAAGLCSAVPGEYEVLGQVRRALGTAREAGTAGPELTELFQRAVAAGRRARHETQIARGTLSFAAATVDLARAELGSALAGATVVVLGAGQLATGVARALRDEPTVARVVVANRTVERARALVSALDDHRLTATGLEDLGALMAEATLVVAALETPTPLLAAADLHGRPHPLLVIDLAVPRATTPDVGHVPGVRRLDLDDLRAVVARAMDERHDAVDAAARLVDEAAAAYFEDRRSRSAAAIVRELRERLESLRGAELERWRAELGALGPEGTDLVAAITKGLIAKIAHAPTVALKDAAGTDRGPRLTDAARTLFDL